MIAGIIVRRALCGLLLAALAGCTTPEQKMPAAFRALTDEALELQRCMSEHGYTSEACAERRKVYDSDVAAFKAQYTNERPSPPAVRPLVSQ